MIVTIDVRNSFVTVRSKDPDEVIQLLKEFGLIDNVYRAENMEVTVRAPNYDESRHLQDLIRNSSQTTG